MGGFLKIVLLVFMYFCGVTGGAADVPAEGFAVQLKPKDFPQVPAAAAKKFISYMQAHLEQPYKARFGPKMTKEQILHFHRYAAIIDFTKPSTEKRFYILDLLRKTSEAYFVAHGRNTGDLWAENFSNDVDSLTSSLGFFTTQDTYVGAFGYSLQLVGLESSNDRAFERNIVLHGASYVSESVIAKTGRLGVSDGCPAVEVKYARPLIDDLKGGSLIYIYRGRPRAAAQEDPELMDVPAASPAVQSVGPDEEQTPEDGDDLMSQPGQ